MKRFYHGVGFDDSGKRNAIYKGKALVWVNPAFQRWKSMLKRCYGPSGMSDDSYMDTMVCEEWHRFSRFEQWMLTQQWEGMDLDKDFLSLHRKIYSPATCAFIPKGVNYFLGSSPKRRGSYPLGVNYDKSREKYAAYVSLGNKSVGLGRFKTSDEAHRAYQEAKLQAGHRLLGSHANDLDPRIAVAMSVVLDSLSDDIEGERETISLHPIRLSGMYKRRIAEQTAVRTA